MGPLELGGHVLVLDCDLIRVESPAQQAGDLHQPFLWHPASLFPHFKISSQSRLNEALQSIAAGLQEHIALCSFLQAV